MSESPWSGSRSGGRTRRLTGRVIEIITVALLAVATAGSAWSAYQVAQWNSIDTTEARASAALRMEASQAYLLATQLVSYDASAIAEYSRAVVADNEELQAFVLETLVRPGFLPVLERWQRQLDAGEPLTNLLEDEAYLIELFSESQELDARALAASQRSEEASSNSSGYIQLTLFFAASLFFAGITASFRSRLPKTILLSAAAATLTVAGMLLLGYPVA